MRTSRLVPAVALMTVLLAPTLAGASGHRHPAPPQQRHPAAPRPVRSGHCRIALEVAPSQTTVGDAVLAFGQLRCGPGAQSGGQTVTLFEHTRGTPGFTAVQNVTAAPDGSYEFAPLTAQYSSMFYVRALGSRSPLRALRVAALVTLTGPPEGTQLLTGFAHRVTFTGTVDPIDEGAHVILQRQNALTGNEWRMIDRSGVVGATGGFTIEHTFRVAGDANLRVLVRSHGRNLASVSNVLTYEISQAENRHLTISASADPISFGQSVTISGAAAGLTNGPVTLLARTARQHGFAPVAEVKTNGSGEYSFPAQSPVNSTFYQVRGGGRRSAVLYEGVKDVLTASVSQMTVQAGDSLTFTGTVAPDHTGHTIYLERQNAINSDFHVIEVASVGAGSAYSIAHEVIVPGTKVFRVRIPGGPENEGAASAPFTVQVTPAPVSALAPEGPGNSSMPAEGEH